MDMLKAIFKRGLFQFVALTLMGWFASSAWGAAWDPNQWTRVGSAVSPATWTPVLVNASTSPRPTGCPVRPTFNSEVQDYIALTQAAGDLQGAAWFGTPAGAANQKVDLTKPFDITFQAYLGNSDGADGIAFVLQNDTDGRSAVAPAGAGSAMGYSGITPSVAVELDTYRNSGSPVYDPTADHVGIMTGGSPNHTTSNRDDCRSRNTMPQGCVALSNDLENNAWHSLRVTWTYTSSTSQTLTVYVDSTTATTSLTGDIISSYLSRATAVYMGLTASTGGENNCHAFYISNIANITYTPTLAVISSFQLGSDGVAQWETASEVGTVGFNLLRQDPASGEFVQVNDRLLPGLLTAPQGGVYRYPDPGVSAGGTYTYQVQEVEARGAIRSYGPFTVTAGVGRQNVARTFAAEATPRADGYERVAHAPNGRTVSPLAARSLAMAAPQASAPRTAARILIERDGVYVVSADQIAAALGVTFQEAQAWINKGKVRLQQGGKPVAWRADPNGQRLYFYGQAVQGVDSIYTRYNVYWLDNKNGVAMNVLAGKGSTPVASAQPFQSSIHVEENHYALPYLVTNPDADFWYWSYVLAGDATQGAPQFTVATPGAVAGGTVTLRAYLQGGTASITGSRHHAHVHVNGVEVGNAAWEGIKPYVLTATFDAALLADGNNTVTVQGELDPGVSLSAFAINGFDLSYPRAYRAVDNRLRLRGAGNPVVTVGGFSGSGIAVLNISDPRQPQWLAATTVAPAGSDYAVSFVPATPGTDYVVAVAAAPVSVEGAAAPTLKAQNSGADYLVLAPNSLRAGANALAAQRSGKVIELQDIYDAFNDGIANPNAIRDFLRYAYRNWQPRPRYVALVGKGTIDPKDYMGLGTDLFPVLMATTPDGLFAADNRYADFNNDGVPELAIGRIPALTADEVTHYVAKLQAYESGGSVTTALLVADNPDNAGNFTTNSDAIKQSLRAKGVAAKPIYYQAGTAANLTRQGIIDGINAGVGMINYVGHAGITQLASEGLLRNEDVSQLTNGSRLPLFLGLTCYVGNGSISGFDSLTETLLWRQGGGIVAAMAPTGMSDNAQAHILNLSIVDALFGSGASPTLGEATNAALTNLARRGGQRYMLDIYQVFGDPALQIHP